MTGARMRPALVVGLLLSFLAVVLRGVQCEDEQVPSEDLCRPYIEKALKHLGTGSLEQTSAEVGTEIDQEDDLGGDEEASPTSEEADEAADDVSKEETDDQEGSVEESAEAAADESKEVIEEQTDASEEKAQEIAEEEQSEEDATDKSVEISTFEEEEAEKAEGASTEATEGEGEQTDSSEKVTESEEAKTEEDDKLDEEKSDEETKVKDEKFEEEGIDDEAKSKEEKEETDESQAEDEEQEESKEATEGEVESNEEAEIQQTSAEASEEVEEESDKEEVESKTEDGAESTEDQTVSAEDEKSDIEEKAQDESAEAESEEKDKESAEDTETADSEDVEEETKSEEAEAKFAEEETEEEEGTTTSAEEETKSEETETKSIEEEDAKTEEEDGKSKEEDAESEEENENVKLRDKREIGEEGAEGESSSGESTEEVASDEEQEPTPEEDLIQEIEIPENLRPRDHINQLLKLDEENEGKERAIQREADIILRDLKRLYDNAIKPLETMYKYRDLSNRHFGDPEIFSKPLVLFMGPWSGGKSSIINYLLDIEYKPMSLRTGAEPSPAYFNIIMHGEEEEVLDGTQLAADWTFSGLQKFGQGLLDRLRGLRLNNKLLEKVNIVEIPGILEIRKQVQRLFPFNDACQWFIDRADIIFLVYDPAKLDVGPETEAILDQLKGREYQTRIILNKADQVKPEELMRVQGALIWNISPLMSSAEPPIMYSTSLWSLPYEAGAPIRLLYAQERAFLRDLRSAINKRVEHKIASARRFAVRVRNHAKMVDCYLTTYYNHKTFFGNKREISDKIIENPQDYHIYEGLSTLTNISRYDLPDPDVYRDFFRLNPLYDFQLLSSTCTYFRGCPINRLDVSIAYDLPELVGNYKKSVEAVLHESEGKSPPS
ncbi:sarcalumenin isoform X2 [Mycetomoellerius zeteki]|uniref:sarcalumenin isoform X2 n=1 Tax=Mycetomoellerius zeteki TaxID=64791 RepID=UPI00084E82CD|nr:PREDICTED: sarcalumenin isoform X2 [Trachymyrmex zeteki]